MTSGGDRDGLRAELVRVERAQPSVIFVDHADVLSDPDDRRALTELIDATAGPTARWSSPSATVRWSRTWCDAPYRYLTLGPVPDLIDASSH